MTIQEVAEAVAVDLESGSFSLDGRFANPFDILEFCSSLVTLSDVTRQPGSYSWYVTESEDTRQLQFAHFSVKEYFLSARTKDLVPSPYQFSEALSHGCITQISLIYLLDFKAGQKMTRKDHADFAFLEYAATFWTDHISQIGEIDREAVESFLLRLFDPKNENHLMNMLNVHDPTPGRVIPMFGGISQATMSRNKNDFEPPLYYAARFGLVPVMRFLLAGLKDGDASRQDVLAAALYGAAIGGQLESTQMLLDSAANPAGPLARDVLFAAASGGNVKVVELLIAAEATICSPADALHYACRLGRILIVQAFLDYGFDAEQGGYRTETALTSAIMSNQHDVVAALVARGVNVNYPLDGYYNPIAQACEHCSMRPQAEKHGPEVVQLLLVAGAEVAAAGGDQYGTALQAAAAHSWVYVDLLLARGADPTVRGGKYGSALNAAVQKGHLRAEKALLKAGATDD